MSIDRFSTAAAILPAAIVVLCLTVFLGSCTRSTPQESQAPQRAADKVYTTRGRIESLPDPKRVTSEFIVHHEPIDEFINPDGSKGMNSMSMPMPTASNVDLSTVGVGDIIEFDLSVWYKPEFKGIESFRVTRVRKLPSDTELRTGKATPTL